MSELKVHTIYTPMDDVAHDEKGKILEGQEVYLKSEADKVIAELERKVDLNKRARQYWRKEWILENKDNCHHKYKRCLAMAWWCAAERDIYNLTPRFAKVEFYKKWHTRWLKLADKFKEDK